MGRHEGFIAHEETEVECTPVYEDRHFSSTVKHVDTKVVGDYARLAAVETPNEATLLHLRKNNARSG